MKFLNYYGLLFQVGNMNSEKTVKRIEKFLEESLSQINQEVSDLLVKGRTRALSFFYKFFDVIR